MFFFLVSIKDIRRSIIFKEIFKFDCYESQMFLFHENYTLDLIFLNLSLHKESNGKKVVLNKNTVIVSHLGNMITSSCENLLDIDQANLSDAKD